MFLVALSSISFLVAGLLFGRLLFGRYREESTALRKRAESLKEELTLERSRLATLQDDYEAQSETCHTLEEEIANIGADRERLLKEANAKTEQEEKVVQASESRLETLAGELERAQDAEIAAKNRARLLRDEKRELFVLVQKLQGRLDQMAASQSTLEKKDRGEQTRVRLRAQRLERRRAEPKVEKRTRRAATRKRMPPRRRWDTPRSRPSRSKGGNRHW